MIPIYICEDCKMTSKAISSFIEKYCMIHDYNASITLVTSKASTLLEQVRKHPRKGIYFLDIVLEENELDGFYLGKEIRKYDPDGFIVYVTAHKELGFKTFDYHIEVLNFICKEDFFQMNKQIGDSLDTIMKRLVNQEINNAKYYYTVKYLDSIKHIPLDEILYFETAERTHRINLYTFSERLDFIGKLSAIEKVVGEQFVRSHRSYLVNYRNIKEVKLSTNEIIMENGHVCLVSKRMKKELLKLMTF